MQRLTPSFYVGALYRFHTQTGPPFFTTLAPLDATLRVADSDLAPLQSQTIGGKAVGDLPLRGGSVRSLHYEVEYDRYVRTNDLRMDIVSCAIGLHFLRIGTAFVATFIAAIEATACSPVESRPIATALPAEAVTTLDGASTTLGSVVRGRVALISFWATWCDGCRKELEALNRLSDRADARGDALVVGVAVGERRETVDAFVKQRGVRYAQVLDEEFRLADALGQRDVPATLVVDRRGKIVYRGEALDGGGLAAFRRTIAEP